MKGIFEIFADEGYVIKGANDSLFNYQLKNGITVKEYIDNFKYRGWDTWNGDKKIHCNLEELSVIEFLMIMDLVNSGVKYFNPFICVLDENMNNEIPAGLPNRMNPDVYDYTDPENPFLVTHEAPKTWNEWIGSNYTKTSIEGFTYFLACGGNNGNTLTDTELMIIYNNEGSTLVDQIPVIE